MEESMVCLISQYSVRFIRARKDTNKDIKDGQKYRTTSIVCTNKRTGQGGQMLEEMEEIVRVRYTRSLWQPPEGA